MEPSSSSPYHHGRDVNPSQPITLTQNVLIDKYSKNVLNTYRSEQGILLEKIENLINFIRTNGPPITSENWKYIEKTNKEIIDNAKSLKSFIDENNRSISYSAKIIIDPIIQKTNEALKDLSHHYLEAMKYRVDKGSTTTPSSSIHTTTTICPNLKELKDLLDGLDHWCRRICYYTASLMNQLEYRYIKKKNKENPGENVNIHFGKVVMKILVYNYIMGEQREMENYAMNTVLNFRTDQPGKLRHIVEDYTKAVQHRINKLTQKYTIYLDKICYNEMISMSALYERAESDSKFLGLSVDQWIANLNEKNLKNVNSDRGIKLAEHMKNRLLEDLTKRFGDVECVERYEKEPEETFTEVRERVQSEPSVRRSTYEDIQPPFFIGEEEEEEEEQYLPFPSNLLYEPGEKSTELSSSQIDEPPGLSAVHPVETSFPSSTSSEIYTLQQKILLERTNELINFIELHPFTTDRDWNHIENERRGILYEVGSLRDAARTVPPDEITKFVEMESIIDSSLSVLNESYSRALDNRINFIPPQTSITTTTTSHHYSLQPSLTSPSLSPSHHQRPHPIQRGILPEEAREERIAQSQVDRRKRRAGLIFDQRQR